MIKTLKKLFGLLDRHSKIVFPLILVMMFIETLFEALGVSLIVPLVSSVMNSDSVTDHSFAAVVCSVLHIEDSGTFIVCCIVMLIALFLVKTVFMLFECKVRYNFICKSRHMVQRKIFSSILERPYEYFLNVQSGEIIREVSDDCNRTFSLFGSLMDVCANLLMTVVIAAVLLIINPVMTLVMVAMLVLLAVILITVVKPTLKKQGRILVRHATRNYKNLLEAVQGIKIVKITKSQQYFNDEFRKNGEKVIEADRKNTVINRIPHAVTEFVCISTALVYVLILYLNGSDIGAMVPAFSAFAVASLKLIPSVKGIINAYYAAAFSEAAVDKVVENYSKANALTPKKAAEPMTLKESIELRDVTYQYPESDRKILDHASLTIPVGKSVGIMGMSGIGKTTSADVLLGLLFPKEGSIAFDGREMGVNIDNYPIRIGYVPQSIFILDDTVRNNIAFGVPEGEIRDDLISEVISAAQLDDFVAALPEGINTGIGENGVRISGGQRQRIGIARALYSNPDLLIFDEATSSLDLKTEESVLQSIEALHGKKTMLIIAHRPQTITNCDYVYRMVDGKFVYEKQQDR